MKYFGWAVALAFVFFVGRAVGESGDPVVVTEVDTVTVERYGALVEELRLERDGLRARLEGIEARPPRVITRVDTLVPAPDTVVRFLSVDPRGRLSVEFLTARDSLYAPELQRGIDVSDCDEGYTVQDGTVLCDRARFGHLYLGPRVSLDPALFARWVPSYRSPWEFGVVRYRDRWGFYGQRSVQIF